MNTKLIDNVNILESRSLISPREIKEKLQPSEETVRSILNNRNQMNAIMDREDRRLFVIVGPCSMHDPKQAIEYAHKLKELADKVKDDLFLVMRVYFEKPRTTVGWKGFITDPHLNDTFDIDHGLYEGRKLLLKIDEIGLPTATEFVDPIIPQYFAELLTWTAIGARTTESQKHREMASGLSTPVGFKNSTDGSLSTALNALISASQSHQFLGINNDGETKVFTTRGNKYGHVVLRGGKTPNFDAQSIAACEASMEKSGVAKNIVVDCSHANSGKDHTKQPEVMLNCMDQIAEGNQSIIGLMLESHLQGGNQSIPKDLAELKHGVSVTDACLDWKGTEELIFATQKKMKGIRLRAS